MEKKAGIPAAKRKVAVSMEEAIDMYIREMKIASGLNTQLVFEAWDKASGAAKYTIARFFRDGKLYITLGSSVLRSQLYFQRDAIMESMNEILSKDPLFVKDDKVSFVKEIILK